MQLYFYDTNETIRQRIQRSPNLDECVIRSLGNVANLDEYRIELNTNIGVDQRRYNVSTVSQVAAIWE
jgi:hypothetical protein